MRKPISVLGFTQSGDMLARAKFTNPSLVAVLSERAEDEMRGMEVLACARTLRNEYKVPLIDTHPRVPFAPRRQAGNGTMNAITFRSRIQPSCSVTLPNIHDAIVDDTINDMVASGLWDVVRIDKFTNWYNFARAVSDHEGWNR